MKFILLLVLINVLLLGVLLLPPSTNVSNYPEVRQLEGKNLSFSELKEFFQNLANEKGAEYAFDVLRVAPVPPGTDMHLMGHVVGDVLYKQQGAAGIKICTEDFRNACSHTIVVGLLLDKGEAALKEISAACKEAPGGMGAYTMCYHGLGHGILSYSDFNLRKAIGLCEKVQDAGFSGSEATQCVSGTIMEIISGGDHDKETWAKQREIYLTDNDPLYPCNSDFMPENARPLCYVYLTPRLLEAAGANLGSPDPSNFKKAFTYCSKIRKEEAGSFDSCYGGFGKEFVVLAAGRDIRANALKSLQKDQFEKVYEWCQLADQEEGAFACIRHATNSYYWGGENDPSVAIAFCSSIGQEPFKNACFAHLISIVDYYSKDEGYRADVCKKMPGNFRPECEKKLVRQ